MQAKDELRKAGVGVGVDVNNVDVAIERMGSVVRVDVDGWVDDGPWVHGGPQDPSGS